MRAESRTNATSIRLRPLTIPARLLKLITRRFSGCIPICTEGGNTVVSFPAFVSTVRGSGGIVIILFTATVVDIRLGTRFIISEKRIIHYYNINNITWHQQSHTYGAGYKFYYRGSDGKRNGVGVVLNSELKKCVTDVKRMNDRVIVVKLLLGDLVL